MKLTAIFLGLVLSFSLCYGQLVNPDFEEWDGNDPVGWFNFNFLFEVVEPSDNAQSGNFAARLMIIEMCEASPLMQTILNVEVEDMVTFQFQYAELAEGTIINYGILGFRGGEAVDGGGDDVTDVNPQYQLLTAEWEPQFDTFDSLLVLLTLMPAGEDVVGSVLVDNVVLHGVTFVGTGDKLVSPTAEWQLGAAYPNPFNAATTLPFAVPRTGMVELGVYDMLGRRVATLARTVYAPGSYRITWNGADDSGSVLPAGVYLVRLTGSKKALYTRVVLIK